MEAGEQHHRGQPEAVSSQHWCQGMPTPTGASAAFPFAHFAHLHGGMGEGWCGGGGARVQVAAAAAALHHLARLMSPPSVREGKLRWVKPCFSFVSCGGGLLLWLLVTGQQ